MQCQIGVISGDGIGPEIVTEAKKVLDRIGEKYNHQFHYTEILMGGCSIDATGVPLTDEAIETALASDAVLMGSIGGNTSTSPWYKLAPELRPEAGLSGTIPRNPCTDTLRFAHVLRYHAPRNPLPPARYRAAQM